MRPPHDADSHSYAIANRAIKPLDCVAGRLAYPSEETMTYRQNPTPTFERVEIGRDFHPDQNSLPPAPVNPDEWTHVCPCRFGEARVCSFSDTTKWTGDSYRYDIFEMVDTINRRHVALRWWNGGGQGWYIVASHLRSGETCLLDVIAAMPDECRRWDACHFLWKAANYNAREARIEEYRSLTQAFAEGRMKKKKVRGQNAYKVTIEPALTSPLRLP